MGSISEFSSGIAQLRPMDRATLRQRAAEISETANFLADELSRLELPEPTFENGFPGLLYGDSVANAEAESARVRLLQMLDEFRAVVTEPPMLLRPPASVINAIVRLKIAENFPPQGATVKDLSTKLGLREDVIRRLLATCSTYHVFHQAAPDFFVHTASSRILSANEGTRMLMQNAATEMVPSTFKIADALLKHPDSDEPAHSGWGIANNMPVPFFEALETLPQRATVFNKAMESLARLPGLASDHLVKNFPLGPSNTNTEITIVDVGGGRGHISSALAKHYPQIRCIVQDSAPAIAQGASDLPPELANRVTFSAHDFFTPQPIKVADIYLLRWILHDWSDKYAIRILQNLIPGLKPGARVIVNDRIVPGFGEVHYLVEREARDSDMFMWGLQNAKERTADDWRTLFANADKRFVVKNIIRPKKSFLGIIEVEWVG